MHLDHDHPAGGVHHHDHEHPHGHTHDCASNCGSCESHCEHTSMEELVAQSWVCPWGCS